MDIEGTVLPGRALPVIASWLRGISLVLLVLKLQCPGCGYVIRTTRTWLDVGIPRLLLRRRLPGTNLDFKGRDGA